MSESVKNLVALPASFRSEINGTVNGTGLTSVAGGLANGTGKSGTGKFGGRPNSNCKTLTLSAIKPNSLWPHISLHLKFLCIYFSYKLVTAIPNRFRKGWQRESKVASRTAMVFRSFITWIAIVTPADRVAPISTGTHGYEIAHILSGACHSVMATTTREHCFRD